MNDYLITQDAFESKEEFEKRKEITLQCLKLNINPITAGVMARMYLNKVILGITYEPEIEQVLDQINKLINIKV